MTDGQDLFFETLQSGSFDLYIYTPIEHEINVELSAYARSYDGGSGSSSSSFSFAYETALVSEPPPCFNPVRNARTSVYYTSIQDAYDDPATINGDTIQSQATSFTENLNFNRPISLALKGGYDCDYNEPPTGETILNGNMTIINGTLTIESGSFKVQ